MAGRFSNLFRGFFNSEKVAGLLLLFTTFISISLANSDIGAAYTSIIHKNIGLFAIHLPHHFTIEHLVNDGLMTIFFLLVGLEIEREIYAGELADFKKAILPVLAAVGGMLVPSLIHFGFNKGTPGQPGFAIPMATDIAFALGILSLAGKGVPTSVKVFLTALAIIDDLGAIVVIALFYTNSISFFYLIAALLIFGFLLALNRLKITNLLFYLLPGLVMWYCFLQSGVHATLSGVLLAFAIPFTGDDEKNVSYHLQQTLHKPVAYFIVPIFALVNTAIVVPPNLIEVVTTTNAMGIIFGLFFGKVIGIVVFPWLLTKLKVAEFQKGITMNRLVGIGFLGGIGFTMSMFISNLAFDNPDMIATSKLCILIGSGLSAITGIVILKLNRNKTSL